MQRPFARRAAAPATLMVLLLVASSGAATHMTTYVRTPEHDDLGRSDEPDMASSSVLGPALTSCNVDTNLDGQCEGAAPAPNPLTGVRVLAPGCWDDTGRRTSGLCWVHGTTGGIAGISGMSGNAAPGAYTPNKGTKVRFLDTILAAQQGTYVDYNHKLRDTGLLAVLSGLDSDFSSDLVLGQAGFMAWYGTWQDKNGNGVIDATDAAASNEFQWRGQCGANVAHVCAVEAASMPLWFYPGNHHSFAVPEVPGMQLVCFVGVPAGVCTATIEDIDTYDAQFQGDPLLGAQDDKRPDSSMDDRTDDAAIANRHWVGGNGFAYAHYDQSLLVSEVVITAVDPPPGAVGGLNPSAARFRDVDVYKTWSPELESLLLGLVKPTLRSNWLTVRDGFVPANKYVDGFLNNRAFDLTDATGIVDDLALDPGQGREPNHAADSYPGAARGLCAGDGTRTHWGMCNAYAGHQSGPHAFADLQLTRSAYLIAPCVNGTCAGVFAPVGIDSGSPGTRLRTEAGDHRRSLGPGFYNAGGNLGVWQDKAHPMVETVLDPLTLAAVTTHYTVGKDGWVGNIVNNTAQYRYRGYLPETCTIGGALALFEHAQCDPYSQGAANNPQDYATPDGEFEGECKPIHAGTLTLRPDGVWGAPTFVVRNLQQIELTTAPAAIEDFTGSSRPMVLKLECISGTVETSGIFLGRDELLLPLGNLGFGVTTEFVSAPLQISPGVFETVRDVDRYEGH